MKTLYIIHGWTYTTDPWNKTIKLLRDHGVTVRMLNVPGLTAPSKKVWTIEEYVAWANKNIPNGAIALGHSNGGRILLNLLSENSEKLSHLILLDSAGIYEESKKRVISKGIAKVFSPLKKIKPLRKVFHKVVGASDYDRAPENMKQTLVNMLNSDKKLNIEKVKTPTTILWGKKDTITPPHQGAKIHKQIEGSKFKLYANWNHAPYISDPDGLARAIYQVMKEIG